MNNITVTYHSFYIDTDIYITPISSSVDTNNKNQFSEDQGSTKVFMNREIIGTELTVKMENKHWLKQALLNIRNISTMTQVFNHYSKGSEW